MYKNEIVVWYYSTWMYYIQMPAKMLRAFALNAILFYHFLYNMIGYDLRAYVNI